MAKPDDLFGTYGSVPTVAPSEQGVGGFRTRANPSDFGAGIGKALQGIGGEASDMGEQWLKQSTEAKVNDDYANSYVPAAISLREKYDSATPADKVHAYEEYTAGLKDLHNQFTSNAAGPYGTHLMGSLINRHAEAEVSGARSQLVAAQKELGWNSQYAVIGANNDQAAQSYNNKPLVDSIREQNDANVTLAHMGQGHDPNTPEGAATIEAAQRQANGKLGTTLVNKAMSVGDVQGAYKLRADFAPVLPGFEQLHLDKLLNEQSMAQVGTYGVEALKNGQPIPSPVGAPAAQVRATVANTAQANGIDPNHALTVALIESNYGQNVGKRGDIGQTGKGGDISQQATNMVTELKKSATVADTALGRQSQPWEQYLCYQQGAGGGPALLNASTQNPAAKAVEVLAPLYASKKDPSGRKTAMSAILNNGGDATMTSGDFLDLIHQKYDDNARRAACNIPKDGKLGDAITAAHSATGEVVQPAATPRQALLNFEKKAAGMMAQIDAMPDNQTREALMQRFNREHATYQAASNGYMNNLVNQAQQLFTDPKFTDIEQMPLEMRQVIAADKPELMKEMRAQAESNLKHEGIARSRDAVNNTPDFYDTIQRVLTPTGEDGMDNPNRIVTENELNGMLGRTHNGISMKDYADGKKALTFSADWKDFLAKNMKEVAAANGDTDGLGQQRAVDFYHSVNKRREQVLAKGGKESDLTDPNSKEYLGTLTPVYSASREQQNANLAMKMRAGAAKSNVPTRQPGETLEQYIKRAGL